jgi:PAS domain S-box-containing protein
MPIAAETASLLERISELEEANANLRRLETAIQRNATLFEALLGANPGGIALTRSDGSIIRVVHGILGYDPNSLSGMPITELIQEEDREIVEECYRELSLNPRIPVQREVRVRRADGIYQWVEFTITDMLDNPAVMALVHNYRDITGRRRRRIYGAELDALSEHSGAAVFSVDRTGAVQTWHPACEHLLGYSLAETEAAQVLSLVPVDLEPVHRAHRTAVVLSGRPSAPFRTELVGRGGKPVSVDLVLAPIFLDGVVQAVAYIARPL